MNYYNDNDPFICRWIENLIRDRLIPRGEVDSRSITDVKPSDLRGFTQCHFFAGICGWPFALKLAGWPESRAVWTGSCPCQPFSAMGQKGGFSDSRHLWPKFHRVIRQCKPSVVFGEQVEAAGLWLDLVLTQLEELGYACGAAAIPAVGVGARHERQRLWFVADADSQRWENAKGISPSQKKAFKRSSSSLVCGDSFRCVSRSLEPGESWIVDGLSGEGRAVAAYGNAIVPQVAAEFIRAYMDCFPR